MYVRADSPGRRRVVFQFLKRKKKDESTDEEREQAEREEAARRKTRSRAAERRVLDALRASRAARQGIELAEQEAQATVDETRKQTDTAVRKVQKYASEISGTFPPLEGDNGRSDAGAPAEAEAEPA